MSLQYDYDHPGFALYEELEVSPRASDPVIRAAYGRLMRVHASDGTRCVRLQKAFDILSNSETRRAYDAQGPERLPGAKAPKAARAPKAPQAGSAGESVAAAAAFTVQTGVIVALSLLAGVLGGLQAMRVLAERGALPFG